MTDLREAVAKALAETMRADQTIKLDALSDAALRAIQEALSDAEDPRKALAEALLG